MDTAKIFENGRSQAIRLPKKFRFSDGEVYVNRVGEAVILLKKAIWETFMNGLNSFTDDFLEDGREQSTDKERGTLMYMLDTNICIYAIKNKPEQVLQRLQENLSKGLCISAITLAELEHGVEKSANPEKNQMALIQFLSILDILPFDDLAAAEYGNICACKSKVRLLVQWIC